MKPVRKALGISLLASALLIPQHTPAYAFISLFMMADRVIKKENKRALATPGHSAWCAKKAPGYRPKWNNWRLPNGRVKYCKSPYFTPLWMKRPK